MEKDYALYENIIENSSKISDIWFNSRENIAGSIYSKNVETSVEKDLKSQHKYTIEAIASGFLEDKEVFKKNLRDWAVIVVASRLQWDTPIYDILGALSKTKKIIWDYITDYSLKNEEIDKQDILRWSAIYQSTLDTLINEFVERYYKATKEKLQDQQELIDETHLPVIPVVEGIAVFPLVGKIDEVRADSLLNTIPVKCSNKNVTALVIDVSGINYIDSLVAQKLFQLIHILGLLGIHCIISGVRPEMAKTSVKIGLDFSQLKTFGDLNQALLYYGVRKYH